MRHETPSEARSHVHFNGPWTDGQRQQILEVTQRFDDRQALLSDVSFGKPWVAVRHDFDESPIMLVSRLGLRKAFRATSIDALADAIERYPASSR